MADGNLKEAWRVAKGWYRAADDRAPKPCYKLVEKQTEERLKLYEKVDPPGDPIPINAKPLEIPEATPQDSEIWADVKDGLKRGRAGGALQFKVQHVK